MLIVNSRISIPLTEFEFSFARSPGPGGQNVNKVNSKAILKWAINDSQSLPESVKLRFLASYKRRISKEGYFLISSSRYRDQARNVDDCTNKLKELILSVAEEPKIRKKRKPSAAAKQRRLNEKKKISARKQDRSNRFEK